MISALQTKPPIESMIIQVPSNMIYEETGPREATFDSIFLATLRSLTLDFSHCRIFVFDFRLVYNKCPNLTYLHVIAERGADIGHNELMIENIDVLPPPLTVLTLEGRCLAVDVSQWGLLARVPRGTRQSPRLKLNILNIPITVNSYFLMYRSSRLFLHANYVCCTNPNEHSQRLRFPLRYFPGAFHCFCQNVRRNRHPILVQP